MSDVCPNCGYCKACGRGNGYWYQPYTYPYTVTTPQWWVTSTGTISGLGGIPYNGGCSLENNGGANDKDEE